MKKSNYIIFAIIILASAALLFVWYYLGFNKVDDPLDLAMSIGWWCISALLIFAIIRVEMRRREKIRTIYVTQAALLNSERGLVQCADSRSRVPLMREILSNLKYDFEREDLDDDDLENVCYLIRTKKYDDGRKKADSSTQTTIVPQDIVWKGTVTKIDRRFSDNVETRFEDEQGLKDALA